MSDKTDTTKVEIVSRWGAIDEWVFRAARGAFYFFGILAAIKYLKGG